MQKAPAPELEDVHFAFNKSCLDAANRAILDRAVDVLKKNPAMRLRLEGHACAFGTAKANQAISRRRVKVVKAYLMRAGIAADRLETVFYGNTRLAIPETPIPRDHYAPAPKANRRVHLGVINP